MIQHPLNIISSFHVVVYLIQLFWASGDSKVHFTKEETKPRWNAEIVYIGWV